MRIVSFISFLPLILNNQFLIYKVSDNTPEYLLESNESLYRIPRANRKKIDEFRTLPIEKNKVKKWNGNIFTYQVENKNEFSPFLKNGKIKWVYLNETVIEPSSKKILELHNEYINYNSFLGIN